MRCAYPPYLAHVSVVSEPFLKAVAAGMTASPQLSPAG
jgi:hypothetical protein